jgi:AcrR family transcriptional regulator
MPERTNRRDLIVRTAAQLFEQNGYQATSTRQIAEAVGCTEAALYYHFREGKHELLETVIRSQFPEMETMLARCAGATSLKEVLMRFSEGMAERPLKMRWVLGTLPYLGIEERAAVLDHFAVLRKGLAEVFAPFVADQTLAARLAWLIMCLGVGYQQLFWDATFSAQTDVTPQEIMQALVEVMA